MRAHFAHFASQQGRGDGILGASLGLFRWRRVAGSKIRSVSRKPVVCFSVTFEK